MNKPWALVTGGSGGIGYAFSEVCAKNGYNIVLVSRTLEDLQKAAEKLEKKFNCKTFVIAKDLASPAAPKEVFQACRAQGIEIELLINNAGFAKFGKFAETDLSRQLGMIDLNIRALTELTGLFLQPMIARKSGKILNVASTAAFQPGPLLAVYYASKAYVLNFSEALRNELKGSGVYVTAVCPGATKSNFLVGEPELAKSKLFKIGNVMEADKVAQIAFDGVHKNKAVVIPGLINKILASANRFAPRTLVTIISRWILEP